jgi:MerR family transcriptional regulator, light-induced transcriptional regulator
MEGLGIKEMAERTGLAAGTIRMWEQRYGFPEPRRTPSGHRRYRPEDAEVVSRAVALRDAGLAIAPALQQARAACAATDSPSIYGAIVAAAGMPIRPRVLRKRMLIPLSHAIEDEALAYGARPVCFGAFQHERFYRRVEHRYRRLAVTAEATTVFADFPRARHTQGHTVELPIDTGAALGGEWAVIVDAPGYAACLTAWERPDAEPEEGQPDGERCFEALMTLDPVTVRSAARVAAGVAGRIDPGHGARLEQLLDGRPLAAERPAPALTALTNRMLEYIDAG